MNTMIVHHHVRNYEAWRPAYDKHEPMRTIGWLDPWAGLPRPNDLVLLFDVADKKRARAFAESDDLKTVMQNAGVEGRPEMYFIG